MFKWFFLLLLLNKVHYNLFGPPQYHQQKQGFFCIINLIFSDSLAAARDLLAVVLRVRLTGPRTGDWATHE